MIRLILLAFVAGLLVSPARAEVLEDTFKNPPVASRPFVWWHWLGPNFSKEGITRDLEAMKAAGIGGATIFNLTSGVRESSAPIENNPWPEQTYRSPANWEAVRHAAAEAKRLGLEIGLHNTVGYSTTGGPWISQEKGMQRLVWSETSVAGGGGTARLVLPKPAIPPYRGWGGGIKEPITFYRDVAVLAVPAEGLPAIEAVQDLSGKMDAAGNLDWSPPSGNWKIYRFGHAPTGATPHPVPDDMLGLCLEADKLSAEATRYHWQQVIDPLKEHLGPLLGDSFKHFLIDSYEAGPQNWSPTFREDFLRLKGYDPAPWLVTLGGLLRNEKGNPSKPVRVIGSEEQTRRFEWDYRDVIARLFYENGWKPAAEAIHAVGAEIQFEPYSGPFDRIEGAALADIPMTEFWTGNNLKSVDTRIVGSARAAGRRIVGAEAFTGRPEVSGWKETPAFLRLTGDGAYGGGINRLVLHHWVHQPFGDRYQPGMGMGWWGTHFSRYQTWFEPGREFFAYLGRVQALLQSGETPADFVSIDTDPPDFSDVISWSAFRAGVKVVDGRIALPSGRTYAFLSVPHQGQMLPGDVSKIQDLLAQGAVIVAKPPTSSPSLAGYPECDTQVRNLAATLWGAGKEAVRTVGKGRLYTAGDPSVALADLGIRPVYEFLKPATDVRVQARQVGGSTLFFVANIKDKPAAFGLSFRVSGKRPEIWDAETGSIAPAPVWRLRDGRTEVDLQLGARKSLFVVFREASLPGDHAVRVDTGDDGAGKIEIVKARFGTPNGDRWADVTDKLRARGDLLSFTVSTRELGIGDPAAMVVKVLELEYCVDGQPRTATIAEGKPLNLGGQGTTPRTAGLRGLPDGGVVIAGLQTTSGKVTFASGQTRAFSFPAPKEISVGGPWEVGFVSSVDQPPPLQMPALRSLTLEDNPSIKYFSGTATYTTTFPLAALPANTRAILDLGEVRDLATVSLNGHKLGVLWSAPFQLDVTAALKAGSNHLEIAVANTWHNRLVGDEQEPADFEWGTDVKNGRSMKAYPDWFLKNQPRPSAGRKAFVTWFYHRKETPLLPAGLLGPVKLQLQNEIRIFPL